MATLRRVLHRVREDIQEYLLYTVHICFKVHLAQSLCRYLKSLVFAVCLRAYDGIYRIEKLSEDEMLRVQYEMPCLYLRDVEYIIDDTQEVLSR